MDVKLNLRRMKMKMTPQLILAIVLVAILAYMVVIPVVIMIRETFIVHPMEQFTIPGSRAGDTTLSHWTKIFASDTSLNSFYRPLLNTLIISFSIAILALLIGGILAWLVVRTDMPHKKLISNLAMVPYIMPSWAMSLAWITLFKNQRVGGAQGVFQFLTGLETPNWFAYGMFPIIITLTLHYFPFGFTMIASALTNIDSQLEESAELLGAPRTHILKKIVFPLITPVLFSTFLLTFSRGLGTFGTPSFLGGPVRFYVLSTMLRANLVGQRTGSGYILAIIMILIGVLVLYMDHKIIGARRSFVTISGKSGKSVPARLGKARTPITVLVLFSLGLVTVVPFFLLAIESFMLIPGDYSFSNLTLHYWIGEATTQYGLGTGEAGVLRNVNIMRALGNSFRLSISTSLICGIAGVLIGYTVVKLKQKKLSQMLDQLSFLPYLMPSIAFGSIFLALFATARGPIPSLYGKFLLLVLACAVKYLPYASRSGISAMRQIGPELEEAAVIHGASWWKRMSRIIFPLQKSSFFSGLLLPFISAMRELSLVVLLVTPGTQLATTITLNFTDRGWYPYTNAVMVLIVFVILFSTYISRKLMKTDLAKGIGG